MDERASFVVVSDLHLEHTGSINTARAAAELVRAYPEREIILCGDVFGLSHDPKEDDPVESALHIIRTYPDLESALRQHLGTGGKLTFLAGNHDAALAERRMQEALSAHLNAPSQQSLTVARWFIRRGAVHIEHGHLWDPDNAPAHPLAGWSVETEPLGISLTRRFVARRGVWQFAHAHETTLFRGLRRAFQLFGWRAPLLVQQYFTTSAGIVIETLFDRGLSQEREQGEAELGQTAIAQGVDEQVLRALLARAPEPTHVHFGRTFFRLYYDRVLAAVGVVAALVWLLRAPSVWPAALAVACGVYLTINVKSAGARYRNRPVRFLREGAAIVHEVSHAKLVIFGHTHVPEVSATYANSGSFGYPVIGKGRPYLVVDAEGQAELRHQ